MAGKKRWTKKREEQLKKDYIAALAPIVDDAWSYDSTANVKYRRCLGTLLLDDAVWAWLGDVASSHQPATSDQLAGILDILRSLGAEVKS